jgi:hypothetical protein
MPSTKSLTDKQERAIDYVFGRDRSILVAPTGEGKTVIALTAVQAMLAEEDFDSHSKIIVTCPPKVVPNYRAEIGKWDHLTGLEVTELVGTPAQRLAAYEQSGRIVVVSLQNLDWLMDLKPKAEGIVIDELSTAAGKYTRQLRHREWQKKIWWRVGMTATPVSHDFTKLFDYARLIAGTSTFGNNKEVFMNTYFYPDFNGNKWTIRDGAADILLSKVAPFIHLIEDRKVETLPGLTEVNRRFDMPVSTRHFYEQMKTEMVLDLYGEDEEELNPEAANQAVKSGKLRQIASGFMYSTDDELLRFDKARSAALVEEMNADPAPALVFYEFEEQRAEIQWSGLNFAFSAKEYHAGEHDGLAVQYRSMSHGVDGMQDLFHRVIFYQPLWSRDGAKQARDRVWRQGQKHPVKVTTLVCNDTLDDVVLDTVEGRGVWAEMLEAHLKSPLEVKGKD